MHGTGTHHESEAKRTAAGMGVQLRMRTRKGQAQQL